MPGIKIGCKCLNEREQKERSNINDHFLSVDTLLLHISPHDLFDCLMKVILLDGPKPSRIHTPAVFTASWVCFYPLSQYHQYCYKVTFRVSRFTSRSCESIGIIYGGDFPTGFTNTNVL